MGEEESSPLLHGSTSSFLHALVHVCFLIAQLLNLKSAFQEMASAFLLFRELSLISGGFSVD